MHAIALGCRTCEIGGALRVKGANNAAGAFCGFDGGKRSGGVGGFVECGYDERHLGDNGVGALLVGGEDGEDVVFGYGQMHWVGDEGLLLAVD